MLPPTVRLGDCHKQGSERGWNSEYKSEFQRSHGPCQQPQPRGKRLPASVKHGLDYADPHCVRSAEQLLGLKIRQAWEGSASRMYQVRRLLESLDRDGRGLVSAEKLRQLLVQHNVLLEPQELEQLVARYDTHGTGHANIHQFLYAVLGEDYPLAAGAPLPLDPTNDWEAWTFYRMKSNGR